MGSSLLLTPFASFLIHTHPYSSLRNLVSNRQSSENSGRNERSRVSGFAPDLSALPRSNRELRHPGKYFSRRLLNRIDCFGSLKSRELVDHETGFPNQHSIVIWFILSHRLPFTLSEAPHKVRRKHLRYLQSKRRSYFCQGLIFKNLIFPVFFA